MRVSIRRAGVLAVVVAGVAGAGMQAQGAVSGLLIQAPSITATAGSSGSFDLLLVDVDPAGAPPIDVAGDSVKLGVTGSTAHFTNTTTATVAPYIYVSSFDNDNGFTLDATPAYPDSDFIVSDVGDSPSFTAVNPGDILGLARVFYSIDAGAQVGDVYQLNIELPNVGTSLSDDMGNGLDFLSSDGSITIAADTAPGAPEPASLTLLAVAAPLLLRRRRATM